MNFIRGMVAADPALRFPSAEDADLVKEGAASFHRQLIVGGLASEYENEIRAWLEEHPDVESFVILDDRRSISSGVTRRYRA